MFNGRKSSLDVGLTGSVDNSIFIRRAYNRAFGGVSEYIQVNFIPPFKTGLLFKI